VLKGAKRLQSRNAPQWDPRVRELYEQESVVAFDGQLDQNLMQPETAKAGHGSGRLTLADLGETEQWLQGNMAPLIAAFRGNHPRYFQSLRKYSVSADPVNINGVLCWELVYVREEQSERTAIDVDPARDFVVVRKTAFIKDAPRWRFDVEYSTDALVGWVPHTWQYSLRVGNELFPWQTGRMTVVQYQLNPEIDDSEFTIRFPPGTRVHDYTGREAAQYVAREDGSKGRSIPDAARPTYAQLTRAAAAPARSKVAMIGSAIVLGIGLLYLALRTYRLRARRAGGW
jgi:hypothetical protein